MNPNPNETVQVVVRKTQVITLYSRQRRMQDFYNLPGVMYLGLSKTTPWKDFDDPEISDTYPPIPDTKMTALQELIGLQRVQWKKYAKPYVSPTTEQQNNSDTVYYKGLYYETTNDLEYAIANEFTSVMIMMTSDRDAYFPVGVSYRQVGAFIEINSTDYYISAEKFSTMPLVDKGHLEAVENFMPLTRQLDQLESHYYCFDF